MRDLKERVIETDVLVIGGGVAGCMAAIKASESNRSVLLVEKADTRRSGCASTGIDHCWTYIPHIHASQLTLEELVSDHTTSAGGFLDQKITYLIASQSYERVQDLERFGVEMRDEHGNYRFVKKIHRAPTFLHFSGQDLKVKLTRELRRRDIPIMNRTMVTELLTCGGRVCGAIGVSTRDYEMSVFKAKAVVLTTGAVNRLYKTRTGMPFNIGYPPHDSGDGHAMAFRAGAELRDMEFRGIGDAGPKNFQRTATGQYGAGSYWPAGRLVNALGQSFQSQRDLQSDKSRDNYTLDPSRESPISFARELESGRGPVYMDCRGASPEQIAYVRWALSNEGNTAWLNYLDEEGVGLEKERLEFATYEARVKGGICINDRCETSLPGLFGGGDVTGGIGRGVLPGALTLGWRAGEMAADYAQKQMESSSHQSDATLIDEKRAFYQTLLVRRRGARWQEAQLALQNIMDYYLGRTRSETMLEAGWKHLQDLRERARAELTAENPHELMRCLEILDLIDVAEMSVLAARERRETRFLPNHLRASYDHYRVDYPATDDENWFQFLVLRRQDGKAVFRKQPIVHIY